MTLTTFARQFDVDPNPPNIDSFAMQPCITFGSVSTLYIMDMGRWDSGTIPLLRMSGDHRPGPSPSAGPPVVFGGWSGLFLIANDFDRNQINAAQLGSASTVLTNDYRMSSSPTYRNGKIWATHTGGLPKSAVDRTVVLWYELTAGTIGAGVISQSGVLDGGSGVHHYYPSIAANSQNCACVGFLPIEFRVRMLRVWSPGAVPATHQVPWTRSPS